VFLKHINQVSRHAWKLGTHLSGDEQTIGFKGKHQDKRRITYKKEGDGFQCDAICDRGYTYCFYFRNQPAPKKYLDMGLSPLHARCTALYDTFKNDYHQVRYDNLFMSAKFALTSYQHPRKVMIEGVTRKTDRGVPREVVQHEAATRTLATKVRGAVKVAKLSGVDALDDCPLVAVSVYDTKPVHFLMMCTEKVEWVTKRRLVWDSSSGMMTEAEFLRLTVNDNYNNYMSMVDQADQLRGYYRPDRFLRQNKWWWSFYFWGHGTLFVNCYCAYRAFMFSRGRKFLPQYEFRRHTILAKLDPLKYLPPQVKASSITTKFLKQQRNRKRKISARSNRDSSSPGTRSKSKKPSRSVYVNDNSLAPNGALNIRLCREVPHMLDPVGKHDVGGKSCQLCRWATGVKLMSQLVRCEDCGVILCTSCWRPFHTVEDMDEVKSEIEAAALERKKAAKGAAKKD